MSRRAAQIEDEARRRSLLAGPFGLGRPRRALAAERHYLPFNGTTNISRIVGGILGYTTQYAVVLKMARLPTTDAGWPVIAHLNQSGNAFVGNLTDYDQVQDSTPDTHRHAGITVAGGTNYARASAAQVSGAQVHMIGRDLTANTARIRVIPSSDQSLYWAPADAATSEDSAPDDIIVGGLANPNGTLNSGPCDVWLVAVLAFWSLPADALLQAYAAPTCRDARPIFGSALKGYWPVSGMVGTSVPALVGSAAMACTGLTAASLVAW